MTRHVFSNRRLPIDSDLQLVLQDGSPKKWIRSFNISVDTISCDFGMSGYSLVGVEILSDVDLVISTIGLQGTDTSDATDTATHKTAINGHIVKANVVTYVPILCDEESPSINDKILIDSVDNTAGTVNYIVGYYSMVLAKNQE